MSNLFHGRLGRRGAGLKRGEVFGGDAVEIGIADGGDVGEKIGPLQGVGEGGKLALEFFSQRRVMDGEVVYKALFFEGVTFFRDAAAEDVAEGVLVVVEGSVAVGGLLEAVGRGDEGVELLASDFEVVFEIGEEVFRLGKGSAEFADLSLRLVELGGDDPVDRLAGFQGNLAGKEEGTAGGSGGRGSVVVVSFEEIFGLVARHVGGAFTEAVRPDGGGEEAFHGDGSIDDAGGEAVNHEAAGAVELAHFIGVGEAAEFILHLIADTGGKEIVEAIDEAEAAGDVAFVFQGGLADRSILFAQLPAV